MSPLASHLSRPTLRARSPLPVTARRPLPGGRRPGRLILSRPASPPAARPAAPSIEQSIRQWIDTNPPQLYRGGA